MKKQFYQNTPLVFSLLISIALAATEVPLWIGVFALLMIVWKYAHEKYQIPKLPTRIASFLGIFIFVIVYIQYKTILGQEESTTILLGLISLTILNYETERDALFLTLLGFLSVLMKSVFSLDFIWIPPALFCFFGLWYSLLKTAKVSKLRYLFKTALLSLPLLVILFVFFPRLIIFQSKQVQRVMAQSGFSEDLNPGRFSEVAQQNQLVFRAEFKNNHMLTEELYWRGAVLNISKGLSWQKGRFQKHQFTAPVSAENKLRYKVVMEPFDLKNIFMLDQPVQILSSSAAVSESNSGQFVLNDLPTQQIQFEATADFTNVRAKENDPVTPPEYLEIPDLPPKTKKLVEDVQKKFSTPKERLQALKNFFAQKGFIYTLKPEMYSNNLDDFLFERKKGFCEHFAAAFATLAHAVQVPARVVVGYQGGSYNSIGNFWKISQKDAHAWVEVGLDGRWQKVDPTGLVTPLRLSLGGEEYFALSEDEQILFSKDRHWKKPDSYGSWFAQVRSFLENLNYDWTVFLLNYDLQTQLDFFKKIQGGWEVALIFVSLFLVFAVYHFKKHRQALKPPHELYDLYLEIENWAQAQGLDIEQHQTPREVLQLIAQKFPNFRNSIEEMLSEYEIVVYQNKKITRNLTKLKKDLRIQIEANSR